MESQKKICVITGTRADYGLLRIVMEAIQGSKQLKLQLISTGMHHSQEFGLTYKEIEKDGFTIDNKVEILLSGDTPSAIIKSMGIAMISFAECFDKLKTLPSAFVLVMLSTLTSTLSSFCLVVDAKI